ncbi:MAG: hypothetical protein GF409_02030 [Candidatus Omnitrophica bacterium]|nr:hypothetical protein [Candidatus Omnitrophota bacterium]
MVISLLVSPLSAAEDLKPDRIEKTVLDNGATVVFNHVPDSPLVTIQLRVLSGLSNEGRFAGTGISHFLEHLLFKGTENLDSEQIRKEIKVMGGFINGSTGLDSAEYHITVPNENYEKALNLLVDMVMQPVFSEEEMEKERQVILKEFKLNQDDPARVRMKLLFSQAYRANIYKFPVIGYEETFKKLTREDIMQYHGAAYTPDRMVLGVTGGIDPRRALLIAKTKLGEYKRGLPWNTTIQKEPRQLAPRRAAASAEVGLGYLAMGFHTTSVYSPDLYAADVLAIMLGGGNDSWLYRHLVKDKQMLYTITSVNYTPRYPGLFIIRAAGEPEDLENAREEIFNIIRQFKDSRIREEEVERAKTMVVSDYLRSQERIESVNSSMTSSQLLTGDPGFFKRYVDQVQKVTPRQIKEIAEKYLKKDNSTTVEVLPEGFQKKRAPESVVEEQAFIGGERSFKLDNGLNVVIKKRNRVPLVSVTLATAGGLRAENKENNGISNLTALSMLKGTRRRDESQIIPVIEQMGGTISAFSGKNSIGLSMTLMPEDLDEGLTLFEDVIKNASFPEDELEKQKKKIIAAIREQDADIFEKGMLYLKGALYGSHPYGMRVLGEVQTVSKITRQDIIEFYEHHMGPSGAVLTVVGDVDVGYTENLLKRRFTRWQGTTETVESVSVSSLEDTIKEDIYMYKEQALLLMGFQSVKITDEDRYVLEVISALMSGTDGLLFHAVREQEGLSYTSGAVSVPQVDRGYFVIYAATVEPRIDEAKKAVAEVIETVLNGQISEEEIEAAKNRLISQHAQSLEANSAVSMVVTLDKLYGLGAENYLEYPEMIRAVKRHDISRVAEKVLDLDRYVQVIVHSEL